MKDKFERLIGMIRNFGLCFSIKYYFYLHYSTARYLDLVYKQIRDDICSTILTYQKKNDFVSDNNKVKPANRKYYIWVCWWQGEKNMPILTRRCYENLILNKPEDAEVILIDKDNYNDFCDIPLWIIEMVNNGKMSITTFSDILRQSLLAQNGGFWIDSTIYVNKRIPEQFMGNYPFWSIKIRKDKLTQNKGTMISGGKWSGFIQKGIKGNIVNSFVQSAFAEYYKKHDITLDYFIQNIIMMIGYNELLSIKKTIDNVEYSNEDVYLLNELLDNPYNDNLWGQCSSIFYKLSYKEKHESQIGEAKTIWGHILEGCINDK